MKIGTTKHLYVRRLVWGNYPLCYPIDSGGYSVILFPRDGEKINYLELTPGEVVVATISGKHLNKQSFFSKDYHRLQRITPNSYKNLNEPEQSNEIKYNLNFVLYDPSVNAALFVGKWNLGNGIEKKLKLKHFGQIEINGEIYSWALKKTKKNGEIKEILEQAETPWLIREVRLPGERSTINGPTSLLENKVLISQSNDLEILKLIIGRHLEGDFRQSGYFFRREVDLLDWVQKFYGSISISCECKYQVKS